MMVRCLNAEVIPEMQKKLRQGFGRAIRTEQDSYVVAILDDEFTVKRLYQRGKRLALIAENRAYPDIVLNEDQQLNIWGVVTAWIVEPR